MKISFVSPDSVGFMAEGVVVEQVVTDNIGWQTIILATSDGGTGTIKLSPEEVAQASLLLPQPDLPIGKVKGGKRH